MTAMANTRLVSDSPQSLYSAFFYGTLMAPSVLHRVISSGGNPSSKNRTTQLTFRPAILPDHRRHRVQYADYPAVVPVPPKNAHITASNLGTTTSQSQSQSQSTTDQASVRGTYVTGLTSSDITRLDIFEGPEYERVAVRIKLLPSKSSEGGGIPEPLAYGGILPGTNPDGTMGENPKYPTRSKAELQKLEPEWADTETYIWIADPGQLEDREWDFEQFRRERLHLWAGREVEDEGMKEVDRRFGSNGEAETAVDGTRGRGVDTGAFEKAVSEREELGRDEA